MHEIFQVQIVSSPWRLGEDGIVSIQIPAGKEKGMAQWTGAHVMAAPFLSGYTVAQGEYNIPSHVQFVQRLLMKAADLHVAVIHLVGDCFPGHAFNVSQPQKFF